MGEPLQSTSYVVLLDLYQGDIDSSLTIIRT